jgi:hypothetical protein
MKRRLTTSTRRRHTVLVAIVTILCCVAAVLTGKLVSMSILATMAVGAYDDTAYAHSAELAKLTQFANFFEPYKSQFNQGTAQAAAGSLTAARASLEDALELAPVSSQCDVRRNLTLVLEKMGEAAAKTEVEISVKYYTAAANVAKHAAATCTQLVPIEHRVEQELAEVEGKQGKDSDKDSDKVGAKSDQPAGAGKDGKVQEPIPSDAALSALRSRLAQGMTDQLERQEEIRSNDRADEVLKPW